MRLFVFCDIVLANQVLDRRQIMAKGKNNNRKNQGARTNDPQRNALLRARNIISGKESNLEGLDDVIAILEQMGKHDLVATLKKHVERLGNQTAGAIVVNEGKADSPAQEALTINEGPDLEEREHPSDFKDNDWFRAYSNEIRTLLTNDANEDEKQITEDDQGIHAPLKNGMVLHFVEQNHVQVATQEDPKPEDFKILVAFAKEQKKDIKLGDQMSDKFREALVVACAQENISITNLPAQYNELYNSHLPAQSESEQQAQKLNDNEPQGRGDTSAEQQTQNNAPVAEPLVQPNAEAQQTPTAGAQTPVAATFVAQSGQTKQTSAVDDKDATIAQLQAKVAELNKQVSELTDIATNRVADDDEDKDTIDGLRRQVRNLTEDLEKSKKENEELQAQLAAQQPAGENTDLLEINNVVAQLRNEVAQLKAQAKQAQEDHQRTLDALVKKDDSITALREQLAEANKTIEELKNNPAPQVQAQVAEAPEPTVRNNAAAAATLASVVQGLQNAAAIREATANAVVPEQEAQNQEPKAQNQEPKAQNQEPSVEYFVTPAEPAEEGTPAPVEQVEQHTEEGTPAPVGQVEQHTELEAKGHTEDEGKQPEQVEVQPAAPLPNQVIGGNEEDDRDRQPSYLSQINYNEAEDPNDAGNGGAGNGGNGGNGGTPNGSGNNGVKRKPWYKRWKIWAAAAVATAVTIWGAAKANLSGASGDKKQNKTEKLANAPKSNVTVTNNASKPQPVAQPDTSVQVVDSTNVDLQPAPVQHDATDAPTTWQEGMKVNPRQFKNMYEIVHAHDSTDGLWNRMWMNASKYAETFSTSPDWLMYGIQRLGAWTNTLNKQMCDKHGGQWADANSGSFGYIVGPLNQMIKCDEELTSTTLEQAKILLSAVDDYGYLRKDVLLQLDPNIAKYNSFSADGRLRGTSRYYMTGTNDDCNNSMNEFKKGAAPRKAKVKYVRPAKEVVYEAPAEEPRQDMPAVDVEKRVDYTINTPVKAPKEQISVNVGASSNSSISMNATDMSQRATDVATGATSFEYATTKNTQPMNKQELSESEKMARKAAKGGVISEEEFLRVQRELDQGR